MDRVALIREPIDLRRMTDALARPDAGAMATFVGTVRAESGDGKSLVALDYSAYDAMAIEQMTALRNRAIQRFALRDAAIVHRLGRLALGEASIAVVVVSGHRPEAFAALPWIVDAVKADVPIWKQDVWSDGTRTWVDPTATA